MINRKKFYKLYESLTNLTDIYGELVEIAKTFEQELGADDVATTGLLSAVAKVNELILAYNPSADELEKAQDVSAQPLQDLQNFDDTPLQDETQLQLQDTGQELPLQDETQLQLQNTGQEELQTEVQEQL